MIVFPESFVETEPDDCLEAALAHEWATSAMATCAGWRSPAAQCRALCSAPVLVAAPRDSSRPGSARRRRGLDAARGRPLAYAETLLGWAPLAHRPQPGRRWRPRPWRSGSGRRCSTRRVRCSSITTTALSPRPHAAGSSSRLSGSAGGGPAVDGHLPAVRRDRAGNEGEGRGEEPCQQRFAHGHTDQRSIRIRRPCARSDGKPVAGAKYISRTLDIMARPRRPVRATSDAAGRFRIDVGKQDFVATAHETPWTTAQVVAKADGFGLGWVDASNEKTRMSILAI